MATLIHSLFRPLLWVANAPRMKSISFMLVSYCGEYPCECKKISSRQIRQIVANIWRMGLRMQFATNRNDRKIQIFVGVRKHSRSFVWRCEYYATLTLWRISCECKTFIFAAYSPEMIRLPRRITEKVRTFKWLRMLPNFLRIPANFLRSLLSVCRFSGESFANVKTTYECITITTNALPSIRIYCDAYENNKNMLS